MVKEIPSPGLFLVVVGDPQGQLVRETLRLAREGEIEAVTCDNVCAAVTKMAGARDRQVLVLGALQELAQEDGAFLRIAAAHDVRCGCLFDQSLPAARKELLAALQAGVTVLGDLQDVRRFLKEGLALSARGPQDAAPDKRRARGAEEMAYEEFRATAAELGALLE
jgi:hypothetical protein